jgi:hypothetical protein
MFESFPQLPLDRMTGQQLAGAISGNQGELMRAECRTLQLVCAWADLHTKEPGEYSPLLERAKFYGGVGTPEISEFCVAELAALQGIGMMTAQMLMADALDLRHRLPRLWTQVVAGQVRGWQARRVAEMTRPLSWEACAEIDAQLSGTLGMLPWGRFRRILAAAILDADPALAEQRAERARRQRDVWSYDSEDGLKTIIARAAAGDVVWFLATLNRIAEILASEGDTDPVELRRSRAIGILAQPAKALQLLAAHRGDVSSAEPAGPSEPGNDDDHRSLTIDPPTPAQLRAGRPRVLLVFHLADAAIRRGHGLVRPEHGETLSLEELRKWLAETGCSVTIRPVLDPADVAPVDAYEIPQWMRDAVRLRNLADVFPFGSCTTATMDLDHSIPWRPIEHGGPSGQTRPGNLGPFTRPHHRAVTHGRWRRRQPEPGQFVFRSPTGTIYLVTNHGTQRLGTSSFAEAVWRAAETSQTDEEEAAA